jgi:hypothetical protein
LLGAGDEPPHASLPPAPAAALDGRHIDLLQGCMGAAAMAAVAHLRTFSSTNIANPAAAVTRALADIREYRTCSAQVAAGRLQQMGAAAAAAASGAGVLGTVRDEGSGAAVPRVLVLWEGGEEVWAEALGLLRGGQLSARELTAFHLVHLGRLDGRRAVRVLRAYAHKAPADCNPCALLLQLIRRQGGA